MLASMGLWLIGLVLHNYLGFVQGLAVLGVRHCECFVELPLLMTLHTTLAPGDHIIPRLQHIGTVTPSYAACPLSDLDEDKKIWFPSPQGSGCWV